MSFTKADFFAAVAAQFNTAGINSSPVWLDEEGNDKLYQIKLVRAGEKAKRPNDLQMPLYGNVIEQYLGEDAPSALVVGGTERFEIIDTTAAPRIASAGSIGGSNVPKAKTAWGNLPDL